MPDIAELAGRNVEVVLLEQLDERTIAIGGERARALRRDERAAGIAGEQDAGLLEAFADRGDPVGDWWIVARQVLHALHDARIGVGRVERAARENVGAAKEHGALRALEHQHFRPAGRIAQQGQCRCRAWHPRCRGNR